MMGKLLAQHIVKDQENGFIRIDMSEYQSKHEMARLIGSPPGYVGHEEGGQLTTRLAKCPDAVVLLDEIEKAHTDVLSLLLQVFDEGRLTDGKGNTVVCPNAIFIMTSNLVQDEIKDALENGYELRPRTSLLKDLEMTTKAIREQGGITTTPLEAQRHDESKDKKQKEQINVAEPKKEEQRQPFTAPTDTLLSAVMDQDAAASPMPSTTIPGTALVGSSSAAASLSKLAGDTEHFLRFIVHPILKRAFKRDEFIGRINDLIIFHHFSSADLQQAVRTELERWSKRAKERHQITIEYTDELVDSLTHAYDERYGYRSIIYGVEKRVVNVLASAHERDRIRSGDRVVLDIVATPVSEPGGGGVATITPGTQPVVIREITPAATDEPKKGTGERKKFLGIF